jgi:hypothetical protein
MDEEERIRRFCHAYAMAQRVLDMAAEQSVHTGMARDEARKQLAIAFELFPATVKAEIARLNEVAAKVHLPGIGDGEGSGTLRAR